MDDRINRILDIGRSKFDLFGYNKTSMDEICKGASISKKTVYEFFKNKEELFLSIFIKEAQSNLEYMLNKVEHIKDPLKKIEKLLRIAVEFHDEKSFMVKALRDSHAQYPPYLKEKYRLQMETQVLNIFTNILKEGTKKGEFRDLDFLAVSYFIFKLFQSITYARTASIKNGRKLLDEFTNFILKGIQKR